jgi:flagellar motility protein MotE (MotC chaperone)
MLMAQPEEKDAKKAASKKPAAEGSTKAKTKQGKNKERKGNTFLLITIILILAFIVSIGAIFMFDFAGLKAETSMWLSNIPVIGNLLKPVVENKSPEQIAKEEIELEKSKNTIALKEITEKIKELDKREKDIRVKELELESKELQINDTLEKLSEKLTSVSEQVQYLEKVDNNKAMQIIMSMDDKASAVQILRNMKKEKASAILGLMDPLQAAQILEDITDQIKLDEASETVAIP